MGQPRSRVGGIGSGVHMRQVAAAKQAGSETLGEWMDRHRLSRDEVASRLTKELGKPISAKAVVMFRNRPSPNSWGEALARSEHAPSEAEPHSERSPIWERAEIKGEAPLAGILVHGRADRIDRLADGGLGIIDYKTGKPPSKKAIST